MMRLNLIGINHHTAPVTVREKAAINIEQLAEYLEQLRKQLPNCVIISTCNRTELYSIENDTNECKNVSFDFLKKRLDLSDVLLARYLFERYDKAAFEHLFRVACGLESLIVGEYEVLGQVKQSLEVAEKTGVVNESLRQVFQSAIRVGRRVREETGISRDALSVSSVAVESAASVTGDLSKRKMLIVGAGEAGQLVGKVAKAKGMSRIVIANRTAERARNLAEVLKASVADINNLKNELDDTDIIVTCAGAPHRLLSADLINTVMQNRHAQMPLVIIDIALPRNVDPEVGKIPDVFLYNMDDFTRISEANRKQRESSIHQAETIITGEIEKLVTWWHDYEVKPTISALMSKAEAIRIAQLNKTLSKLPPLSDEQMSNLDAMTRSIVTRMLANTIQYLKTNGNGQNSEIIREIFQLDKETSR